MKKTRRTWLIPAILLVLGTLLYSFAKPYGGEGYQVLVNNKIVLDRFGKNMDQVQTLSLAEYPADAQISIKYYHCGKVARNRVIELKNEQQQVIKRWRFIDVAESFSPMHCSMKEISLVQVSKSTERVDLYYSSSELPDGRLLVKLVNKDLAKK